LRAPFIVFIYESSTLGKAYRIKVRCYWEHIGKLMGTQWEHIGDNRESLRPRAKPQKKKKKTNKKNWALMSACSASHWLHENHGHKTICRHCPLLFPIFAYHNHYFLKEFWCSLTGCFIGRCRRVVIIPISTYEAHRYILALLSYHIWVYIVLSYGLGDGPKLAFSF
jgi:hypothetical protein